MSRKTSTALVVSLAAILAVAVAATSASAFTIKPKFEHFKVRGTLTAKKLNQTITLPTGEFNGEATLTFVPEPEGTVGVEGPLTGTTTIPPFETEIKLLGIPAKVGLTFTATEPAAGSLTSIPPKECEGKNACEHLSVPTHANIGFTTITILGLTVPTKCTTAEPVFLNLGVNETLSKLLGLEEPAGSFFSGTATFPRVTCEGILGPIEGALLTALFSGPNNPYMLSVTPT
jgi:hypothetical protein